MGGGLQVFQGARANATGGEIDHAQEGGIVIRVAQKPQVSQRMLDFLALEEAQAAINLVRHGTGKQLMFEHPRLGVGAIENGDLIRRQPITDQLAHLVNDETCFIQIGISFKKADRLAIAGIRP